MDTPFKSARAPGHDSSQSPMPMAVVTGPDQQTGKEALNVLLARAGIVNATRPGPFLVDLRGKRIGQKQLSSLQKTLKRTDSEANFLIDPDTPPARAEALAGMGTLIIGEVTPTTLRSHLEAGQRLFWARRDFAWRQMASRTLQRRFETKSDAKRSLFDEADWIDRFAIPRLKGRRVLIAGTPSPVLLELMALIRTHGGSSESVMQPGHAIRALETGIFNAAVFLPDRPGEPLGALARAMRRHARLRTIPLLIGCPRDQRSAFEKHSPSLAEKLFVTDGPLALFPATFLSEIRLNQINTALARATNMMGARQPETCHRDLYTSAFMGDYAHQLLRHADREDLSLGFIALQVDFDAERLAQIDFPRELATAKVGQVVARSMRCSDLLTRLNVARGRPVLVASLGPQTNDNLRRLVSRLEAIVHSTPVNQNPEQPVAARVTSAATIRVRGTAMEETIATLMQRLSMAA